MIKISYINEGLTFPDKADPAAHDPRPVNGIEQISELQFHVMVGETIYFIDLPCEINGQEITTAEQFCTTLGISI